MTGLNRRHIRLETDICINCAISFKDLRVQIYYFFPSLQQGSNLQPSVYKTDALPVELKRRLSCLLKDSNPRMSVLRTDTLAASPSELLLGPRDSNSHRRFWRPLCCRCTMPQSCGRCEIRTHGTLSGPSVFWTGALNHLGQPSVSSRDGAIRTRGLGIPNAAPWTNWATSR